MNTTTARNKLKETVDSEAQQSNHPGRGISVFASGALFLGVIFYYFPALIYRENSIFVDSPFLYMVLVALPVYLPLVGVLTLTGRILRQRWRNIYAAALASYALVGLFIGNFLFFNRGVLDGRSLLKSDPIQYQIGELIAVCLAFIVLTVLATRFPRMFGRIILFLNCMVITIVLIAVVTDKKEWAGLKSKENKTEAFYTLSSRKNVFVFLFDSVQADLVVEILKHKPAFQKKFDGFTFFSKAAGVAPTTYLSMPSIHSGMEYTPGSSLQSYYRTAVGNESFMAKLHSNHYDSAIMNNIGICPRGVNCVKSGEIKVGVMMSAAQDEVQFLDFSIYRILPSFFKDRVYNNGKWFLHAFVEGNRAVEELKALQKLKENFRVRTEQPVARFIHSFCTHPPAGVDANCNPVEDIPWTRNSARDQTTCALNIVAGMFDYLKTIHAYDNSLIVVMADHGFGFDQHRKPQILQAANPLFMVKPISQHGELQISSKNVFLTDVAATICGLTNDCENTRGVSVFQVNEAVPRSVVFNEYKWKHEYWRSKKVPIKNRFEITGPVDDVFSWHKITTPAHLNTSSVSFTPADNPEMFGFGWSGPQTDHRKNTYRWAYGPTAQLYLRLEPNRESVIEVVVLNHKANRKQRMKIYIDDQCVGQASLRTSKRNALRFDVPANAITKPVSRITFTFSNFRGEGLGSKSLAAAFDELKVYPK